MMSVVGTAHSLVVDDDVCCLGANVLDIRTSSGPVKELLTDGIAGVVCIPVLTAPTTGLVLFPMSLTISSFSDLGGFCLDKEVICRGVNVYG